MKSIQRSTKGYYFYSARHDQTCSLLLCASKGEDDGFERAKKRVEKLEVPGTCHVEVEDRVGMASGELLGNLMTAAKPEDDRVS